MTSFIPLPHELLDHTLSDAALQDRWVAGAEKKLHGLYQSRKEWRRQRSAMLPDEFEDGLHELDELIGEAEAFLDQAKRAQADYHRQERKEGPQHLPAPPPQVQALFTRRTPAQVQALLDGIVEQGQELADTTPPRAALPKPPRSRRAVLKEQKEQCKLDALLEDANRMLLPKPKTSS